MKSKSLITLLSKGLKKSVFSSLKGEKKDTKENNQEEQDYQPFRIYKDKEKKKDENKNEE